ncbi:hypothetical protein [Arthrobacter sp. UM1]|uniref:hypothetical protein n=1 Tax=Arthrobacter sp. UM1 TaxID=2766776 RepID=UPI001CF6E874|nr:hypothetical protein [Arthrobacter sp. UM1]MCB4207773.1 hypothetical protein [Arthrobacter sp. UM1]
MAADTQLLAVVRRAAGLAWGLAAAFWALAAPGLSERGPAGGLGSSAAACVCALGAVCAVRRGAPTAAALTSLGRAVGGAALARSGLKSRRPGDTPSRNPKIALAAEGESLWDLAERVLRAEGRPLPAETAELWEAMWEQNRWAVGDRPDRLPAETRIVIPAPRP